MMVSDFQRRPGGCSKNFGALFAPIRRRARASRSRQTPHHERWQSRGARAGGRRAVRAGRHVRQEPDPEEGCVEGHLLPRGLHHHRQRRQRCDASRAPRLFTFASVRRLTPLAPAPSPARRHGNRQRGSQERSRPRFPHQLYRRLHRRRHLLARHPHRQEARHRTVGPPGRHLRRRRHRDVRRRVQRRHVHVPPGVRRRGAIHLRQPQSEGAPRRTRARVASASAREPRPAACFAHPSVFPSAAPRQLSLTGSLALGPVGRTADGAAYINMDKKTEGTRRVGETYRARSFRSRRFVPASRFAPSRSGSAS